MIGRGEHAEIITFVGKTVDSELSGNVIDLCPVGALTSKPFRYTARTWELTRKPSVSPHCGLGSNLTRAGEAEPRDAGAAARERGGQRVLAVRQGPLLVRRPEFRAAARKTDAEAGRDMEGSRVAGRARLHRQGTQAHPGPARRREHRGLGDATPDARGAFPVGQTRARVCLRQRGFPPAPVRFQRRRQACRRALARHDGGRGEPARPSPGDRLDPEEGASANRASPAAGREAALPS